VLAHKDPEAAKDMTQQDENENEEPKSLGCLAQLERTAYLLEQFPFILHQFEKSKESRDLDQFVKLADPSYSHELVILADGSFLVLVDERQHQVEGKDADNINNEPAFKVDFGYFLPVGDVIELTVLNDRIEVDDNIKEKENVDDVIGDDDARDLVQIVLESKVQRSQNAGGKEDEGDDEVPVHFEVAIGVEQRCTAI
jgi:hypothetical protein